MLWGSRAACPGDPLLRFLGALSPNPGDPVLLPGDPILPLLGDPMPGCILWGMRGARDKAPQSLPDSPALRRLGGKSEVVHLRVRVAQPAPEAQTPAAAPTWPASAASAVGRQSGSPFSAPCS